MATGAAGGGAARSGLSGFFRFPRLATFLLAWTVGAVDASTYERFGVFTSNQAGNIVIISANAFAEPSSNLLPAISLGGAAAGVAAGMWLAHRSTQLGHGVVAPTILASVLLLCGAMVEILAGSEYLLIPATSAGMACLAAALLHLPMVGMWITANTGQWLTAVAGLLGPREGSGLWRGVGRLGRNAAVLIVGFAGGAIFAGSGVLKQQAILLGLAPAIIAIAIGLVHNSRHGEPDQPSDEAPAR